MPNWTTFPDIAGRSIVENDFDIDDPIVENAFENGWTDVRVKRSRARYDNVRVTFVVNSADKDTILGFLRDRRLRSEPFYFKHDKLGTMFVRLKAPVQKVEFFILGQPVWYRIELIFQEMF